MIFFFFFLSKIDALLLSRFDVLEKGRGRKMELECLFFFGGVEENNNDKKGNHRKKEQCTSMFREGYS